MPSRVATDRETRQRIMNLRQAGKTHQEIADELSMSFWTVRKWARRTKDGELKNLESKMGRPETGPLAGCETKVKYRILRLKLEHPDWGQDYIFLHLKKDPELQDSKIPSSISIWRYWRTFGDRLLQSKQKYEPNPPPVWEVHAMWQLDFKESYNVPGIGPTTFTHARDTVGRATVLHRVHVADNPEQTIVKPTSRQVQADCRIAFAQWGLPDTIQTDHASLFTDGGETPFPKLLPLWWVGLGIGHQLLVRSPIENGSVERSHLTMVNRTVSGRLFGTPDELQIQLDRDWEELNTECPSKARGCNGLPPAMAFPDLYHPRRHYFPEQEAQLFSMQLVYDYLSSFCWIRTVSERGSLSLGGETYGLGKAWRKRQVQITFNPNRVQFTFALLDPDESFEYPPVTLEPINLSAQDIMGEVALPDYQQPEQLHFPLAAFGPTVPMRQGA